MGWLVFYGQKLKPHISTYLTQKPLFAMSSSYHILPIYIFFCILSTEKHGHAEG